MSHAIVHAELEAVKGDKVKLMQQYGEKLQAILNEYGGNLSDIPMDATHPYHKIQDKIRILGAMSQSELTASRLEPDKELELKNKGKKK